MNTRENTLKAVRFETPDYIPVSFKINDACWNTYPLDQLLDLMEAHPFLFPDFKRPQTPFRPVLSNVARKDHPYLDDWGCLWQTAMDGITGTVTAHPLSDWAAFDTYTAPDAGSCMGIGSIDWTAEKARIRQLKAQGALTMEGLRHGHTFLQLCDIRGYENLIFDMVDEEPRLLQLLRMVEDFNLTIVQKYLDMDVDIITYAEDLGMQIGPMLSPAQFRRYIVPSYRRLMKPAQDKGTLIHMHSDGDIRLLASDLITSGVSVINLQDLVNGLDYIKDTLCGRVCIELDIDRQSVTAQGTPAQIKDLIRQEVQTLGSRQGGLMLVYGLYPGLPFENIRALMDALEEYAFYYS